MACGRDKQKTGLHFLRVCSCHWDCPYSVVFHFLKAGGGWPTSETFRTYWRDQCLKNTARGGSLAWLGKSSCLTSPAPLLSGRALPFSSRKPTDLTGPQDPRTGLGSEMADSLVASLHFTEESTEAQRSPADSKPESWPLRGAALTVPEPHHTPRLPRPTRCGAAGKELGRARTDFCACFLTDLRPPAPPPSQP